MICEIRMEKIIRTERLFLREMNNDDFDALYRVLADKTIMRHYPYTFDEARVHKWIETNIERYRVFGFGLWAVCLKDTGELIGDCGLTMQNIGGFIRHEIGYHISRYDDADGGVCSDLLAEKPIQRKQSRGHGRDDQQGRNSIYDRAVCCCDGTILLHIAGVPYCKYPAKHIVRHNELPCSLPHIQENSLLCYCLCCK